MSVGGMPSKHAQSVRRLPLANFQGGNQGFGLLQNLFGLVGVALGCRTVFELVGRQLKRFSLNLDVRTSIHQPLLERAILNVVRRHVREQHDEHVVVVFDGRIQFRIRRLDRTAIAAPEVEFPRRSQAGVPIGKPRRAGGLAAFWLSFTRA